MSLFMHRENEGPIKSRCADELFRPGVYMRAEKKTRQNKIKLKQ